MIRYVSRCLRLTSGTFLFSFFFLLSPLLLFLSVPFRSSSLTLSSVSRTRKAWEPYPATGDRVSGRTWLRTTGRDTPTILCPPVEPGNVPLETR